MPPYRLRSGFVMSGLVIEEIRTETAAGRQIDLTAANRAGDAGYLPFGAAPGAGDDEAGFATVANLAFAGAPWRVRRRLPPTMRPALDAAR
jgi:hypothetical protein